MNYFGLHGVLKAQQGKGEELTTILLKASTVVSQLDGCFLYLVSKDSMNQDEIWVTEVWKTKDDHDKSLKDPSVRELISKAIPLLNGSPTKGQELVVIGGLGIKK